MDKEDVEYIHMLTNAHTHTHTHTHTHVRAHSIKRIKQCHLQQQGWTRDYHIQWSKSDIYKYPMISLIVESKKNDTNLFTKYK